VILLILLFSIILISLAIPEFIINTKVIKENYCNIDFFESEEIKNKSFKTFNDDVTRGIFLAS